MYYSIEQLNLFEKRLNNVVQSDTSTFSRMKTLLVVGCLFTLVYAQTDCGELLSNDTGSIRSPNHPGYYPHNVRCDWYITVHNGYIISLTFTVFHTANSGDPVTIYARSGAQLTRYSGYYANPPHIESPDNYMRVLFTSDSSSSNIGFSAYYVAHDPGWSPWVSGRCSTTCGIGTQTRTRTCTKPAPSHGGPACIGKPTEITSCTVKPCEHVGWSQWVNGKCSTTCGPGSLTMTRTCTNPAPSGGGKSCIGSNQQAALCKLADCPVHLRWSDWRNGPCTVSCGKGTLMRQRTCSIPDNTAIGKMNCSAGVAKESVECIMAPCEIPGGWTNWTVGRCSASCGPGISVHTRSCTNPRPSGGGMPCQGSSAQSVICELACCPRDGGWTNWVNGRCTTTCGDGTQMRTRSCTKPPPFCGGKQCNGATREATYCTEAPCKG